MKQDIIPAIVITADASLAVLANGANAAHDKGQQAERSSLEHYRQAGLFLIEARKRIEGHTWLKWLGENVTFAQQTASKYIRIASNWDKVCSILPPGGNMGLHEVLNLLAEEKMPPPEPIPHREQPTYTSSDYDEEPEEEAELSATNQPQLFPLPTAPVQSPSPSGGRIGKPGEFITLDQWSEMSKAERKESLLVEGPAKRFNDQGNNEGIQWALWSWNPITGCHHNCPYCYARDIANRFYEPRFEPAIWPSRLSAPANTPRPDAKIAELRATGKRDDNTRAMGLGNVFTCSMADLFGRWVPKEWIDAVLAVVRDSPQWNFLFLTKFPQRMAEFHFPDNAWVGTTVDCQARVANAEKAFRKIEAGVKWLSCEPLIEPLRFSDLGAFDWVVLGGSSASSQTPEWHPPREWVNSIEAEAARLGVHVYEKANLLARITQYPGVEPELIEEAPESLRYLPR